jgi:SET domain-containing protein
MKSKPTFKLKVKKARAGLGLFAMEAIPKGSTIVEYVGEKIPAKGESSGKYVFSINSKWDIDGRVRWNTARYVNHSCRPNCEAVNRRGRIFIVAKRNIKSSEELYYHYGKEYFHGIILKNGCLCEKCEVSGRKERAIKA